MAETEFVNIEELDYGKDQVIRTVRCTDDVYIREEPSTDSEALGVIRCGEKISVLEENDQWYRHESGWSMKQYFR